MKKLSLLGSLWISVILGLVSAGYSANTCAPSDIYCYQAGPAGNLNTTGRLDASGNLYVTGSAVVSGSTNTSRTVYTPSYQNGVSSMTTLTNASSYILTASSGGMVTIGGTVASLSTATAVNGQFVILGTTVTQSNWITLSSGTASGMDLGAATRAISYGKKIGLIYDAAVSMWVELYYGSN